MRIFNRIIQDSKAPNTFDLWINKGKLKYFDGGWKDLGGNEQVSWNDIQGKPELSAVATSGSYNDLSDTPTIPEAYTLPVASNTVLGGVKIGEGINVGPDGTISCSPSSGGSALVLNISNWQDNGTATSEEIQTIKNALNNNIPLIVKNGTNTLTWQCVSLSNENDILGNPMLAIDLVRMSYDTNTDSYKIIGHLWSIEENTGTLHLHTANL